jgi:hypothetical protein
MFSEAGFGHSAVGGVVWLSVIDYLELQAARFEIKPEKGAQAIWFPLNCAEEESRLF